MLRRWDGRGSDILATVYSGALAGVAQVGHVASVQGREGGTCGGFFDCNEAHGHRHMSVGDGFAVVLSGRERWWPIPGTSEVDFLFVAGCLSVQWSSV